VESVQRHLGGRLAQALGRQGADHFARLHNRLRGKVVYGINFETISASTSTKNPYRAKAGFHLAQQPLERLLVQLVLLGHLLGAQCGPEQNVHQNCGIVLSLGADRVVARDNDQLLGQLPNSLDHFDWALEKKDENKK
jgi:hypothetical protein